MEMVNNYVNKGGVKNSIDNNKKETKRKMINKNPQNTSQQALL